MVTGSPAITSAASTTFTAGAAGSFTVTATGTPTPTLTESGALPTGITFTAGTNGTATLAGTPAATTGGTYPISLLATNASGKTTQAFVITVNRIPTITSPAALTETAGTAFTFTVASAAAPTAALTESGALPSGVTFTDNGNGTASIAGSAAVGTSTLTLKASNTAGSATQTFTLKVNAAGTSGANVPVFTSAASTTIAVNANFDFTVTTKASSQSATFTTNLSESGTLPPGVDFSNNGDGTADITGPATGGGVFPITITAKNSGGSTTQSFVLTVNGPPAITTAATQSATVGSTFGFTVKTSGYPLPALTETGALPAGLTFKDNGNGTATMSGTPDAGTGGAYPITISAKNASGTVTQAFTLTVLQPPSVTSASSATAVHGTAFSFKFVATGYPVPTITHTGTVAGLSWSNTGSGTFTLSGTPTTAGKYTLTVTATNSSGTTTQTFTLTVTEPEDGLRDDRVPRSARGPCTDGIGSFHRAGGQAQDVDRGVPHTRDGHGRARRVRRAGRGGPGPGGPVPSGLRPGRSGRRPPAGRGPGRRDPGPLHLHPGDLRRVRRRVPGPLDGVDRRGGQPERGQGRRRPGDLVPDARRPAPGGTGGSEPTRPGGRRSGRCAAEHGDHAEHPAATRAATTPRRSTSSQTAARAKTPSCHRWASSSPRGMADPAMAPMTADPAPTKNAWTRGSAAAGRSAPPRR